MKLVRAVALALAWLVLPMAAPAAEGLSSSRLDRDPYWLDETRSCGPMCVAFLDRYWHGGKTYAEVAARCNPGPQGTSLLDLKQALEGFGYHTLGFRSSVESLGSLPTPMIVQMKTVPIEVDLFVVFVRSDPLRKRLLIFDPSAQLEKVSLDQLRERFSGVGLHTS